MPKLPILKSSEVIKILENIGFMEIRQKGSHKQFKHVDGRQTTVPFHKGRDLSPLLLDKIIKDIGLTRDEFMYLCSTALPVLNILKQVPAEVYAEF